MVTGSMDIRVFESVNDALAWISCVQSQVKLPTNEHNRTNWSLIVKSMVQAGLAANKSVEKHIARLKYRESI
jgi:PBP1b-binding outer membrane lipoprotein LpoB